MYFPIFNFTSFQAIVKENYVTKIFQSLNRPNKSILQTKQIIKQNDLSDFEKVQLTNSVVKKDIQL